MSESSNRSIRGLIPVYSNDDYDLVATKVKKEELYLSKSLQKSNPEPVPAPSYDAAKIAEIIQAFLLCE